jgi:hypothetical protein
MVGSRSAVGQIIAFAEGVRMRRQRESRLCHARCCEIISASVVAARAALQVAPPREIGVWVSRVRKLEELAAWVGVASP